MFQSIWQDIKTRFEYGDTVIQLILVNLLVWVGVILIGLIATPFVGIGAENPIIPWLAVPSEGLSLLTRPWTILTYMFLHEGLFHIAFNMIFLYAFGIVLANYLGKHRIIPIYVIGGLMGFVLYFLSANLLPSSFSSYIGSPMLGASAGVMAIVMAAATVVPTHVFHLILIGPVQIRYIALFFVLLDLLAIQNGSNTGGHLAHLGGVFWGYFFVTQLSKGNDYGKWFNRNFDNIKNAFYGLKDSQPKKEPKQKKKKKEKKKKEPKMAFNKKQQPKSEKGDTGGSRQTDSSDQARVDAILDKIKESGYQNLSKEEKDFLFKVSKDK